MSNVWFCSDLHFGHKGIGKFRGLLGISTEEDNTLLIKNDWKDLVHKRDFVYVLGDAAFTMDAVEEFADLPGTKYLVRGNHDQLNTQAYLKYFKEVYGILKYKEFWLSHAPIHPEELRGKTNLHGHVHFSSIRYPFEVGQPIDRRYLNCCPENLMPTYDRCLVSLYQIRTSLSYKDDS